MDTATRRAEFERNLIEAHDIMAAMRVRIRIESLAIFESRGAIADSWSVLRSVSGKEA